MGTPKSPWWMCCGWWSPWCVLDTAAHACHINVKWICDRHDAKIMKRCKTDEDWFESENINPTQLMHHFDTLEPVEIAAGKTRVIVREDVD